MIETVAEILVRRDGISLEEAHALVTEARERVLGGEDPEEILYEDFDLEPDYIWELV